MIGSTTSSRAPVCVSASFLPPGGLLLRLRNRDLLGVPRVQDHCQDARVALRGRVPRHAVQAAGRLVERVPRLERLGRLVVDGPLVLALQDVADQDRKRTRLKSSPLGITYAV